MTTNKKGALRPPSGLPPVPPVDETIRPPAGPPPPPSELAAGSIVAVKPPPYPPVPIINHAYRPTQQSCGTCPPPMMESCPRDDLCGPFVTLMTIDCAELSPVLGGTMDAVAAQALMLRIISAIVGLFSVIELGVGG